MRKLLEIGIPVAHGAEPSSIDVEHVDAQSGGVANHARGDFFVHICAAAPTVVHDERIARIFPGFGITENRTHPWTKDVTRTVIAIAKSAEKDCWRLERFSRKETSSGGARIGI